jgi:hypothetical protein
MARNVMSLKEQLKLVEIIKATYKESGMDNVSYAKTIDWKEGGFRAPVTEFHIRTALEATGTEPNKHRRAPAGTLGDCLGLTQRVQDLEERVEKLANYIKGMTK